MRIPRRREDEHDHDPGIEAVEAAAALRAERSAAIRTERRGPQAVGDPAGHADVLEARRLGPRRQGRRRCRHGRCSRAPEPARGGERQQAGSWRDLAAGIDDRPFPARLHAGSRVELLLEPFPSRRSKLRPGPCRRCRMHHRHDGHADLGADQRTHRKPVADRAGRRVGGRIDRREDDVHVGEGRDGQDHVGDPPPPRDREEDRPQREEREPVALVDAGRGCEEGQGDDGQSDGDREAVRVAPHGQQDGQDDHDQQCRTDRDGRHGRRTGRCRLRIGLPAGSPRRIPIGLRRRD